jgi:hypothetical protein
MNELLKKINNLKILINMYGSNSILISIPEFSGWAEENHEIFLSG